MNLSTILYVILALVVVAAAILLFMANKNSK